MAILKKKGKKVNVNDRVKQAVTTAAVGAGVQIVDALLKDKAEDVVSYVELGVGVALPILVPGTERVGDAVAAVAAYKTAQRIDIAKQFGIGEKDKTDTPAKKPEAPKTNGVFEGYDAIGNPVPFFEDKKKAEKKEKKTNDTILVS